MQVWGWLYSGTIDCTQASPWPVQLPLTLQEEQFHVHTSDNNKQRTLETRTMCKINRLAGCIEPHFSPTMATKASTKCNI